VKILLAIQKRFETNRTSTAVLNRSELENIWTLFPVPTEHMLIESLILLLGDFEVVFVSVPLYEGSFRDDP